MIFGLVSDFVRFPFKKLLIGNSSFEFIRIIMVIKANKSVLGEDWLKSFFSCRNNLEIFLDKKKLTREAFCLDILKDLYLDHIELQNKIHLLLLLQEHSSNLITDLNLLEQTVESLVKLCGLLGTKQEKRFLKSQILISCTTILLVWHSEENITELLQKVKGLLLGIIYKSEDNGNVISAACKCLEEIETMYPGILEAELPKLTSACEKELSPHFQSYTLLINTCLKNVVSKLNTLDNSLVETKVFNDKQISQISHIVSLTIQLLPFMTNAAIYKVLKDMIGFVIYTPELKPTTFKLCLQTLISSSDVTLLHLAFDLLETFSSQLFSSQEENYLVSHLIKLSTHPCLTASHRLLFLDWLKSFVSRHDVKGFYSDLQGVLPGPFDGPLTQEKKAHVLAMCIPSSVNESDVCLFLNENINGLVKCSLLPFGTKAAPSLFRILFVYLSKCQLQQMYNSTYKLVTNVMKMSPHLTCYALSFLQSMKENFDQSFHAEILGHLVDHILSAPIKQFHSNLSHYLAILENASHEESHICKPRSVLRLLQKWMNDPNVQKENLWCIGNEILAISHCFLKYHDVQIFFYDLAEVLCFVMSTFNDADIKDRAKIYYSMLTALSKIKVQAIFDLHSNEKDVINPLSSFVTGSDSLHFVSTIQKLSQPILELVRINLSEETTREEIPEDKTVIPNALEIYQRSISESYPEVKLPFVLKHVNGTEKGFSNLYSIVISVYSYPSCKEISDIELPVLSETNLSEDKGAIVFINLVPLEPHPLTLHFKAEFTCENGYSYSCHLQPATLNFEDLCLPLPIPRDLNICARTWRQQLFKAMWEDFKEKLNEQDSRFCESALCLTIQTEDISSIAEKKWKLFLIDKYSDGAYDVAMFLPPSSNLLIKLKIVNEKAFANILLDNKSTLPFAMTYLQNLK